MADGRGIALIHPTSYRESRAIGEHLRDGDVVILDVSEMETEEMHRLVDFVSGLVFGLQGNIDRVTAFVLAIAPPGVTLIDDAEHLTGSFYNQS